MNEGEFN